MFNWPEPAMDALRSSDRAGGLSAPLLNALLVITLRSRLDGARTLNAPATVVVLPPLPLWRMPPFSRRLGRVTVALLSGLRRKIPVGSSCRESPGNVAVAASRGDRRILPAPDPTK
jgi:hypothetical protein